MYTHARGECTDELLSLARGPDFRVNTFAGCNVNGFRFHIKARERERKTQNSGVMVKGEHADKETYFYGIITDIVEVEYSFTQNRVVVFKCDWWDLRNNSGIKVDKQSNITSINMSKTWYSDQPFILASQAEQVFYLQDMKLGGNWHVVELVSPRSSYDVPEKHEDDLVDNEEAYQEEYHEDLIGVQENLELVSLKRGDVQTEERIEAGAMFFIELSASRARQLDDNFIDNDEEIEQQFNSEDENEQFVQIDDYESD